MAETKANLESIEAFSFSYIYSYLDSIGDAENLLYLTAQYLEESPSKTDYWINHIQVPVFEFFIQKNNLFFIKDGSLPSVEEIINRSVEMRRKIKEEDISDIRDMSGVRVKQSLLSIIDSTVLEVLYKRVEFDYFCRMRAERVM